MDLWYLASMWFAVATYTKLVSGFLVAVCQCLCIRLNSVLNNLSNNVFSLHYMSSHLHKKTHYVPRHSSCVVQFWLVGESLISCLCGRRGRSSEFAESEEGGIKQFRQIMQWGLRPCTHWWRLMYTHTSISAALRFSFLTDFIIIQPTSFRLAGNGLQCSDLIHCSLCHWAIWEKTQLCCHCRQKKAWHKESRW